QKRYGHDDAHDRGHERLRDTARHQLRVAGAEQRDLLERDDHPGHGAEKPEQRAHGREDLERAEPRLEPRYLPQYRCLELALARYVAYFRVLFVHAHLATDRSAV